MKMALVGLRLHVNETITRGSKRIAATWGSRNVITSTTSTARGVHRQWRSLATSSTTTTTTSRSAARSTESTGWRFPSQNTVLYTSGGALAAFSVVYFTPLFKTTREGIVVAWRWKDLTVDEIAEVAEAWVWQFWIGFAGLMAGISATRATVDKAVQKSGGSLLIPFKIPLLVLGGVLGAKFTTSTARPAAEFVLLAGRMAEFTLDGLAGDFLGKPRHELAWVKRGVTSHDPSKPSSGQEVEAVPYETKSDNILRDLALVRGDINDPKACGPYRHKLLLVRELGKLREQERVIRQSQQDPKVKDKFIKQIEAEKARIKKMCKDLYGFKIGRLYEEIQSEAALKLEDLRSEQLAMVRARARVSELQKLDREKAKLKAQAKLALGVKLSSLTRPSPKWKQVMREMGQLNAADLR